MISGFEDPPEMILEFAAKHEKGTTSYGERVDREESSLMKTRESFSYRILRAVG